MRSVHYSRTHRPALLHRASFGLQLSYIRCGASVTQTASVKAPKYFACFFVGRKYRVRLAKKTACAEP
eukprot:6172297-Pleurochrysis_carterae.AAC.2